MFVQKTQHLRWRTIPGNYEHSGDDEEISAAHRHLQWVGVQEFHSRSTSKRTLSRPEVICPKTPPKTPPKRPPAKTQSVKGVPKKAKATELVEIKVLLEEFSHEHLHQREQWKKWLGMMLQPEISQDG